MGHGGTWGPMGTCAMGPWGPPEMRKHGPRGQKWDQNGPMMGPCWAHDGPNMGPYGSGLGRPTLQTREQGCPITGGYVWVSVDIMVDPLQY
jgi:hypothetical protein